MIDCMRRALLVIDVQESFRQCEIWQANSNPNIVKRVQQLTETFREKRELVIWVLHHEPGTGGVFDPALGLVRLMDGLDPEPGEPTLYKSTHNAFTATDLQPLLTSASVREVVVCGIRTEQCVETTARLSCDLGYMTTVVIDATATNPIEHRDAPPGRPLAEILADPHTLQVDEIIKRTEYALSGRFATIRTVEELAAA